MENFLAKARMQSRRPSGQPPRRRWVETLLGVAAAAMLAAFFLWPPSGVPTASLVETKAAASQDASHAGLSHPGVSQRRIADIRVGDRVLGRNPELSDEDRQEAEAEPNPSTWRKIALRMAKPDGHTIDIELLRPLEWIEDTEAKPGATAYLDLIELGAEGDAEVLSIEPCPLIHHGAGNVVTGTFHHSATNVIDLRLEGEAKPIGCTANHPFWSMDREEFVAAGDLRPGERMLGRSGESLGVVDSTPRDGLQHVYNVEVHGEHVYRVGALGSMAHNICPGQHHFIPVALGNRIPYGNKSLSFFKAANHTRVQGALNKFLRTQTKNVNGRVVDMYARCGNSGKTVMRNFSRAECAQAVETFYKGFENGRYYPAYRMELNVLNKFGGLR